jgi:hypothetical protein
MILVSVNLIVVYLISSSLKWEFFVGMMIVMNF